MSQKQPNPPPHKLGVPVALPVARPNDRYSLQYMLWRRLQVRQAMNMRSGMD